MPLPGFQYTDLNIGVENVTPIKRVVQYVDFNIGLEPVEILDAVGYADFNVGLEPQPREGAEYSDFNMHTNPGQYRRGVYLDFNIDPETSPVPHIWYIRPQYGKEGLIFNVYGQGLGITQDEFDGKVMLNELECAVTQWMVVPAQATRVLRVGGYLPGTGTIPRGFRMTPDAANTGENERTVVLETGDIIEFDYTVRTGLAPLEGEIRFVPFFMKRNSAGTSVAAWTEGQLDALPDDQNGIGWFDPMPHVVGLVQHRRFIVPSSLNNQRTADWGIGVMGSYSIGRPNRVADFGGYVIRAADGTVKKWVTRDDGSDARLGFNDAVGSYLSDLTREEASQFWTTVGFINGPTNQPFYIDDGATNVEHEWIIVVVPEGAESGMVRVVLEDV